MANWSSCTMWIGFSSNLFFRHNDQWMNINECQWISKSSIIIKSAPILISITPMLQPGTNVPQTKLLLRRRMKTRQWPQLLNLSVVHPRWASLVQRLRELTLLAVVAELATATYQQLESAMNSGLARRLGNEARLHKVYDNPIDTRWLGGLEFQGCPM